MFGEKASLSKILNIVWTPMKIQISMLLIIALTGVFLLPVVVENILPKYAPGVLTAQWILFLPVIKAFGLFCNIYNVVQKQLWYLIALLSGALIGVIFIFIKLQLFGFNLCYFPQGLILGSFFQILFAFYFLKKKILSVDVQTS